MLRNRNFAVGLVIALIFASRMDPRIPLGVGLFLQAYTGMVEQISPFNKNLRLPGVSGAWSTESTPELMALGKEALRQATMIGYLNSFVAFAAIALVALPLVLLAK